MSVSRAFHVTLHARPPGLAAGSAFSCSGRTYATLAVSAGAAAMPLEVSFEQASAAMAALERMFIEPDGSFVWTSSASPPQWQLDGVLYDRHGRLLFVDMKGNCLPAAFDRLLATFGWPETPVMFQLLREAVFLDETEFRRWWQPPE